MEGMHDLDFTICPYNDNEQVICWINIITKKCIDGIPSPPQLYCEAGNKLSKIKFVCVWSILY